MNIVLEEEETKTYERELGFISGDINQPLVIFIGGIHGNEPMGVRALIHVFDEIEKKQIHLEGTMLGLAGNLEALKLQKRFLQHDLNRIWDDQRVNSKENIGDLTLENKELQALWQLINKHIEGHKSDRICIFDLHTTSSDSVPFITINDTLSNRQISKQIPVPTIFGIEEFLSGPLLSYINELGYNALGFEGGQHDSEEALLNHIAFIWLALAVKGLLSFDHQNVTEAKKRLMSVSQEPYKFFEIIYRQHIEENDLFEMQRGFNNFQTISTGERLGELNSRFLSSEWNARIFMPLYQPQGNDGYFIIRPISKWVLWLSKYMRHYELERFLLWLPGITMVDGKKHILKVNLKVAKFKSKEVFHMLGYRQKVYSKDSITFIRREKQ